MSCDTAVTVLLLAAWGGLLSHSGAAGLADAGLTCNPVGGGNSR